MCRKNIIFLVALLLCSPWAVLQAQEQWYLITEPELRSIEEYKRNSEAEKQTWLLQVQALNTRAGSLEADSITLNSQLQNQRELNRKLTQLFDEYEAGQSALLSSKNGEIAGLKESLAGEKLKHQKSRNLNLILGWILGLTAVLAAVYLYVKIRTGGLKLPTLFR